MKVTSYSKQLSLTLSAMALACSTNHRICNDEPCLFLSQSLLGFHIIGCMFVIKYLGGKDLQVKNMNEIHSTQSF
jgi:hypothetical protein